MNSSKKVYGDYTKANYGESTAESIAAIINQNELFVTDFAECQATSGFNKVVNAYPLMNIQPLSFTGKHGGFVKTDAVDFQGKEGIENAPSDKGGECAGYVVADDWLKYDQVRFKDDASFISLRVASASNGSIIIISVGKLDGPMIASIDVKDTERQQAWKSLTILVKIDKGIYSLYVSFCPFNDTIQANKLAEEQLNTTDSYMAWVTNLGRRRRLSYLRTRIAGAKHHIALNSESEKYQWTDLPGQTDS